MADILLIDDDEAFRELLRRMVEDLGHTVREAKNGREATSRFEERPSEVLLTDLLMPEKDGFETIRDLRKRFPGIKIIAMSGGGRMNASTYLNVAEQLGAWETLYKPFSRDELRAALDHVLVQPENGHGSL